MEHFHSDQGGKGLSILQRIFLFLYFIAAKETYQKRWRCQVLCQWHDHNRTPEASAIFVHMFRCSLLILNCCVSLITRNQDFATWPTNILKRKQKLNISLGNTFFWEMGCVSRQIFWYKEKNWYRLPRYWWWYCTVRYHDQHHGSRVPGKQVTVTIIASTRWSTTPVSDSWKCTR